MRDKSEKLPKSIDRFPFDGDQWKAFEILKTKWKDQQTRKWHNGKPSARDYHGQGALRSMSERWPCLNKSKWVRDCVPRSAAHSEYHRHFGENPRDMGEGKGKKAAGRKRSFAVPIDRAMIIAPDVGIGLRTHFM
jgi:hypothetical protein